jgi:hypothetical protein
MRRYVIAFALVALVSAPLSAELKYTSRMSAKVVEGATAGNDMMAAMVGPMMLQMFGGEEGVEMTVTVNEDGRMRTDYAAGFVGMPAGAVVLMQADGTSLGYDATAGTWWKMGDAGNNPEMAAMMAQMKPDVTTKRTGEFATVAGLRAERVSTVMTMPIPMPEGLDQLPPQVLAMIPTEIRVDGDMWIADAHAKYAKAMAKAMAQSPMAAMGFDKLMSALDGFSVRQVMRMSMLAGYELETLVSRVAEEDVPDSVFDVPAGLKEIPMPTPNIR